ncbi:hypothetical protein BpHYR1_050233 [Brachionus plicatilis]|uniref:Uncharacterized protein n=1 Tax=Brachionus plicatilis TaxID=10195 RepID=A0A3M7RK80_BRAPC|nr:hypothetical protein BpHYR1_050233 [Brachionus plicatilis]
MSDKYLIIIKKIFHKILSNPHHKQIDLINCVDVTSLGKSVSSMNFMNCLRLATHSFTFQIKKLLVAVRSIPGVCNGWFHQIL